MSVEVLTAVIATDAPKLHACWAAVAAQTVPVKHRIELDNPPHNDHGSWLFTKMVIDSGADLVLCLAVDETLKPQAIEWALAKLSEKQADFVMWHRTWSNEGKVTGVPPEKWNLTTGLFPPRLIRESNFLGKSQPGADGEIAWDWLQKGYKMAVVPAVLSTLTP